MKIKVKLVGQYFPQEFIGKEVEVDIANIYFEDGSYYSVDNSFGRFEGYEIEAVETSEESSKKDDNSISFGSNSLKSMSVEFK